MISLTIFSTCKVLFLCQLLQVCHCTLLSWSKCLSAHVWSHVVLPAGIRGPLGYSAAYTAIDPPKGHFDCTRLFADDLYVLQQPFVYSMSPRVWACCCFVCVCSHQVLLWAWASERWRKLPRRASDTMVQQVNHPHCSKFLCHHEQGCSCCRWQNYGGLISETNTWMLHFLRSEKQTFMAVIMLLQYYSESSRSVICSYCLW